MTTTHRSLAPSWTDFPAFYAGFLIVACILAALTNFGASLLFLAAGMTFSLAYEHRKRKRSVSRAAMERAPDLFVILTGLVTSIILSPASGLLAERGRLRAAGTLLRAGVGFAAKSFVLLRLVGTVAWTSKRPETKRPAPVSSLERVLLLSLIFVGLVLLVTPFLVRGGAATVLQVLRSELIPWRM